MSEIVKIFFTGTEIMFGSNNKVDEVKRAKLLDSKKEIRRIKTILNHSPIERSNNRIKGIVEEALN